MHFLITMQCPTTIVPFFGDQPFWGERVHARGVGPPPIPVDEFSLQKLVEAINFMLQPEVKILHSSSLFAVLHCQVEAQIFCFAAPHTCTVQFPFTENEENHSVPN